MCFVGRICAYVQPGDTSDRHIRKNKLCLRFLCIPLGITVPELRNCYYGYISPVAFTRYTHCRYSLEEKSVPSHMFSDEFRIFRGFGLCVTFLDHIHVGCGLMHVAWSFQSLFYSRCGHPHTPTSRHCGKNEIFKPFAPCQTFSKVIRKLWQKERKRNFFESWARKFFVGSGHTRVTHTHQSGAHI